LILEELERYGNIVIMEKEDESYAIFTRKPYQVIRFFTKHKIQYEEPEPIYAKAEGKKQEWMIDFCLR
jgi:hypothetical protein